MVVEGTGGWRSLMNDLRPLSEWVVQEQMGVLMVVGIQEGCINHALLTAQAIASDGLPLIGWVANRINLWLAHYAEIINVLSRKLPAPLVGSYLICRVPNSATGAVYQFADGERDAGRRACIGVNRQPDPDGGASA